jgi:hypothetical protein
VQYRENVLLWPKSDEKKKPGPLLLVYFMLSLLGLVGYGWHKSLWTQSAKLTADS